MNPMSKIRCYILCKLKYCLLFTIPFSYQNGISQNVQTDKIKFQIDSLEKIILKNNIEIENINNFNLNINKELIVLKDAYNNAIIENQKGTTFICTAGTLLYSNTNQLESLAQIKRGNKVKVIEILENQYKVNFNDLVGFVNKYGFMSEDEFNNQAINQAKQKSDNEEKEKRYQEEIIKEKENKKIELIKKYGKINGVKIFDGEIWIGMTDNMVYDSQGKPKDINKTVGKWGVHEQWIYENNTYLYIENGKLVSWQY